MSLISKQIDDLRDYAKSRYGYLAKIINDAADTIELLSAKLSAANMERSSAYYHGDWIPCNKKLPDPNFSVLVQLNDDFADPIQIMTLNISKCEGDFFCSWRTQEMGIDFDMDDVVAWMPLPKEYRPEGEKK